MRRYLATEFGKNPKGWLDSMYVGIQPWLYLPMLLLAVIKIIFATVVLQFFGGILMAVIFGVIGIGKGILNIFYVLVPLVISPLFGVFGHARTNSEKIREYEESS